MRKGKCQKVYKTELHVHTSNVSRCGSIKGEDIAEIYKREGYKTVVVTDHFSLHTFPDWKQLDHKQMVEHFMEGYEAVKSNAGDDLNVLLGAEMHLDESDNDYLVYGIDKQFLYGCEGFMGWNIKEFSDFCRQNNVLLVQAHPFRSSMKIIDPELLDGIEVNNGSINWQSRNQIALEWAKLNPHLIKTGGSDYHHSKSSPNAGIMTQKPIETTEQFMETLKSGEYKVF